MATYYFRNTGDTNWGTASNWSLTDGGGATGAVPTSADDAYFTSNSGNCTVNASARVCKTLIFSGVGAGNYSGTLTMTFAITVSGSVTLSSTMTITGAGALNIIATSTITSNGKIWPTPLAFGNIITVTLADNLTVNNNVSFTFAGGATTVNGNTMNIGGNLALTSTVTVNGTTSIVLNGTGSWTAFGSTSVLQLPVTINTSGTITISGNIYYSGTLTYTAGTVTTTGSTLNLMASSTLNTSGMTWNNVGTSSGTYTLSSNLNLNGNLALSGGGTVTINGNTVNVGGSLTTSGVGPYTGTTTIVLNGTGTWSSSSAAILQINTIINTTGTITISGNVYFNTGTLTYTSGTVIATGSTLNISASTTLNTSSMSWNNVTFSGIATITLTSDLNINGLFAIAIVNSVTVNGTFNINANGGFSNGYSLSQGTGTTTLNIKGGTWTNSLAAAWLYVNTNIDGNVTISGTVSFGQRTLRYISGNIITTGSRIRLEGTCSLDTNGILWNNLGTDSGYPTALITLLSDLNINGVLSSAATTTEFGGNYNINCNGGLSLSSEIRQIAGTTTTLNLFGGIWTAGTTSGIVRTNMNLRGNITISGNVYYNTNTLTYILGNVICNRGSIFNIGVYNNGTLINMDKINFRTVSIPANASITMNRFFSGSALVPTRIQSTGTNYTITFQDGFEKITKFIKISNCTVSRPNQLLCITDKSNKGGNVGIRYINQSPNGLPKNAPSSATPMTYGLAPGVADPLFVTS